MAVSPNGRMLYIGTGSTDGKGPGDVISVDPRSGRTGTPVRFPHAVTGLALSPDGRRLFALATSYQCTGEGACGGRCDLAGLDTSTGMALKTVRLGSGCDQVTVTPDGDHVLVLSVDESLTTLNSTTVRVEKTTRTAGFIAGDGASGCWLAPGGHTLYIADQFKGIVVLPVPS